MSGDTPPAPGPDDGTVTSPQRLSNLSKFGNLAEVMESDLSDEIKTACVELRKEGDALIKGRKSGSGSP
ncbi:hypothetical protein [Aurantiacibacter zhengii]|uniref:hypothetical protein n=1 Tax=Aurantiacibacter zhengii TaxID=2307003 RepID=UPI0011C20EE6|nr:hypothetical protein [Aurantiacibacter zhengii]